MTHVEALVVIVVTVTWLVLHRVLAEATKHETALRTEGREKQGHVKDHSNSAVSLLYFYSAND